jgi:hypothetical protein
MNPITTGPIERYSIGWLAQEFSMRPTLSVSKTHTNKSKNLQANLKKIKSQSVYLGIPSTSVADRTRQLVGMAATAPGAKKKEKLLAEAAANRVNNAEVLYIFSKGSPGNKQPARPVLEPSVVADGNREAIAHELSLAAKAQLDGNSSEARKRLKRAGIAGENAAKGWFTDSRNNWAPNSPRTIIAKGSDRPGIDTTAMLGAITSVIKDDF